MTAPFGLRALHVASAVATLGSIALGSGGCRAHPAALRPPLTTEEWSSRRESFLSFRAALQPAAPYVARIRAEMHVPPSGRAFEARGAVAVDPGRALRMVLVGPGGATALDAWVTRDRWRLAVPPLALVRRGGADALSERGLPVGFLRWWFLSPLDGSLLARDPLGSPVFGVVRDGAATIEVFARAGDRRTCVAAVRRRGTMHESLASCIALGAAPREGDRATYDELDTGLHVDIAVEGEGGTPDREAFADPDVASPGGGS